MALTTTPTTDNGRIVAGMYEAFGRGDVPAVLERIAPDADWIETESTDVPVNGRHRGPDAVLQNVFAKVGENFDSFALEPELFLEAGDDVVVTGRIRARTKGGRELDAPYAHIFSLRDGRVVRNDNHHDTALWLAALRD